MTVRESQLLVSNNSHKCRVAAVSACVVGAVFVGMSAGLLYAFTSLLGFIFINDPDVVYRMQLLSSIVAIFQVFNGIQIITGGILAAVGRQMQLTGYCVFS